MDTFVTGFINLTALENNAQRRDPKTYLKHAKKLLQKDIHLYLFLEEDMVEVCKKEREGHGLLSKTYIETISFPELNTYPLFKQVEKNRQVNTVVNANGVKDTASYITVVNAKMDLVRKAMEKNPFGSTRFGWVDFGIYHVALEGGNPYSIPTDKIKLQLMEPFGRDTPLLPKRQYRKIQGKISAGFITGSVDYWKRFHQVFYEEFERAVEMGYGPSEEQIFPVLSIKYPDLFEYYYGRYETILVNYDTQRICFALCRYQLRKCETLNLEQGVQMSRYLFDCIVKGREQKDLMENLSAYLGILVLTYRYHKLKYGIRHEVCDQVVKHYQEKKKDPRFALFRNNSIFPS